MLSKTIQNSQFFTRIQASAIFAMLALLLGTACNRNESDNEGELPLVTLTIPPLEYFAHEIGGDSIRTSTLMPAGTDPESFEPGLSAMRGLNRSGSLITIGLLPFEQKLESTLKGGKNQIQVYRMAEGVNLIYGTHTHRHSANEKHHDKEADPHIWSSVKNGRVIADNMLAALVKIAPEHTAYFTSRHKELIHRLDSIDQSATQRLESIPSRTFVAWHPSLSYLARDYNLEQMAVNVENKESSSLQLHSVISEAAARHPSVFLIPAGTGTARAEAIAASLKLSPAEVNLMSADWENDITTIINLLTSP